MQDTLTTAICINEVGDVIKKVLGDEFVYNGAPRGSSSASLVYALTQAEEFMALYTEVLWDEFIPDLKRTSNAKLSTLFTRNLTYIGKHGLVTVKRKMSTLVTADLFENQARHVKQKLIDYAAKASAFGRVFDETKIAQDENRRIDLVGHRARIRASLAEELYNTFVPRLSAEGSIYAGMYTAFVSAGYFQDEKIADAMLDRFIAVLLMSALNLYPEGSREFNDLILRTENYISESKNLCRGQRREESSFESLSRADAAKLCMELAFEVSRRFDKGERVSRETMASIIKCVGITKKYQ
jgi:hypothetical protein